MKIGQRAHDRRDSRIAGTLCSHKPHFSVLLLPDGSRRRLKTKYLSFGRKRRELPEELRQQGHDRQSISKIATRVGLSYAETVDTLLRGAS